MFQTLKRNKLFKLLAPIAIALLGLSAMALALPGVSPAMLDGLQQIPAVGPAVGMFTIQTTMAQTATIATAAVDMVSILTEFIPDFVVYITLAIFGGIGIFLFRRALKSG